MAALKASWKELKEFKRTSAEKHTCIEEVFRAERSALTFDHQVIRENESIKQECRVLKEKLGTLTAAVAVLVERVAPENDA